MYMQPEYWPTLQGYTSGTASYYKTDGTGLNPSAVHGGGWAASGDEAHFYTECSGKGVCDRTVGECTCYDGFSGAACQRSEWRRRRVRGTRDRAVAMGRGFSLAPMLPPLLPPTRSTLVPRS